MSLRREDLVEAALEILDEFGLQDLSMRRLGDALGVKAGALYWHVRDKQSLLGVVADRILSEVEPPVPAAWRETCTGWAGAVRTVLLRHRDSAELVTSMRAMGLLTVDVAAVPREALVAGGLDEQVAASAAAALTHFILGHLVEEQSREQWRALGVVREDRQVTPSTATQESYAAGVTLLLDGVAAQR